MGGLKNPPTLNKHGQPIEHKFFELPMSDEGLKFAVEQGWKRKTVYSRDAKTGELMPRTMFEVPEPKEKQCKDC